MNNLKNELESLKSQLEEHERIGETLKERVDYLEKKFTEEEQEFPNVGDIYYYVGSNSTY